MAEAFAYAAERTLAATVNTLVGPQHPTYRYELGGREDLVLTRPGAGARLLGTLALPEGHFLVHRGRADGTIAAEVASDAPRRLALDHGTYVVVVRRGADDLRQGAFVVRAGETTRVDVHAMQRFEYARVVRKGGRRRAAYSLFADAGVRGELVGLGVAWRTELGARVDLRPLSLELRLAVSGARTSNDAVTNTTNELAVLGRRCTPSDSRGVTLGVGGEVGAAWFSQRFHPVENVLVPDRNSAAFFFGLLAQLEVPIRGRFYARAEAALLTYKPLSSRAMTGHSDRAADHLYRALAGLGFYL